MQRLTLTVHINGVVVEMGSSLLLHITHAIIPLASQCAIAVIRWKQTLLLAACVCLGESEYSGVDFNIYCTWAPVSPADKASSQTLLSAFPSQPVFFSPLVFSTEPSRGPLQGPQACPEAQSHGGAEEQAAASRRGLVHGEGARPRQRPGTRPGPEQDVRTRGGSPRAHGHELSGGNKYVNRHRDGKKAALDDHSIVLCFL